MGNLCFKQSRFKLIKAIFFILLFFSESFAFANEERKIILQSRNDNFDIDARSLSIFEDKSNKLNIEDIKNLDKTNNFKFFKKKVLTFGFSSSTFWIKLPILKKENRKEWLLSVNFPDLDDVLLFKKSATGNWDISYGGDIYSSKKRDYVHKDFVFSLSPLEETVSYLRVKSRGALTIPLQIMTKESFFNLRGKSRYFFGGYYSVLIFMCFYNLIIAFYLKSKPFYYYAGYLVSLTWMTLVLSGVGRCYFFDYNWFSNEGFVFSLITMFFFLLSFTKEFIGVEKIFTKINKLYTISFYSIALFLFLAPLIKLETNLNLIAGSAVPAISTAILTGFYFFRTKRAARFYVLSFIMVSIGGITKALTAYGIFPSTFLIENGVFLGFLVQVALLSLGLADVINELRQQAKEKADNLNMANQKLNVMYIKIEKANEELEGIVTERTQEAVNEKNKAEESEKNISGLLNNMKQSVFSINGEGSIIPPVSNYSYEIFGEDLGGKSIFQTLLRDVDKKSEVYTQLGFAIGITVGADLFQFQIVQDALPKNIIILDKDQNEKSLKINYSPIFENDETIKHIMLVIEDITELKKLEEEAKKIEAASSIKVQRLQEIVSQDKKD